MIMKDRNKKVFSLETLEDRVALSAFGQAVAANAHDPEGRLGCANMGEWQSGVARDVFISDGVKGMGEFNGKGGTVKG